MIKPISSKVLRNTVLGLFSAGSMGVAAANMHKNNSYVTEPNSTELISKAGAEALKTNSMLQVITKDAIPTVHNNKLDSVMRKCIEDDHDRKQINGLIDNLYENFGTFLGTAYLQHELNTRALYTFMTGNTQMLRDSINAPKFADEIDSYGEDFYKTVKPNTDEVLKWAIGTYTPYFANILRFDHKPDADEVITKMNDIIKNDPILLDEEKEMILIMSDNYNNAMLHRKKDIQSRANLIAFKVNLYDTYMFWHELRAAGIYNGDYFTISDKNIKSFYLEWMDKFCPDRFDDINNK